MVNPEFKSFNLTVKSAGRFTLQTNRGEMVDFSGSAMTAGYRFCELPIEPISALVFRTEPLIKLNKRLKQLSGYQKAAYANSGTEACDMALSRHGGAIISFEGSYHGRSFLTFRASNGTGIDRNLKIVHLKYPGNSVPMERVIEYNSGMLDEASKLFSIEGASIILELIQSDGGEIVAPKVFLDYIEKLVEKHKMHLIIDEVYTGAGRSGSFLLSREYGLNPDMICLGKGIAAGLPMGIVLYNGEWSLPTENGALGMLGGNSMACAAALKVLDSLADDRLRFVMQKGEEIMSRIRKVNNPKVGEVRGRGFMIGVEFVDSSGKPNTGFAYRFRDALVENHVICGLVGEANNVLKITPPVLIDDETMEKGIRAILKTLKEVVD